MHGANGAVDDVVATEASLARARARVPRLALVLVAPPLRRRAPTRRSRFCIARRALVPRRRRASFDPRARSSARVDRDTPFFEIGAGWARGTVVELARGSAAVVRRRRERRARRRRRAHRRRRAQEVRLPRAARRVPRARRRARRPARLRGRRGRRARRDNPRGRGRDLAALYGLAAGTSRSSCGAATASAARSR